MMKTKNIFSLLLGLVSLIFISSCNSILNKDPLTEYSSSNFWNEPAQASSALTGAYIRLQSALNTEFFYYGDARADITDLYLQNNVQNIAVIYNRLDPNLPFTDWGNFYKVINQANLIINNVNIMNDKGLYVGKTSEYNRVMGQALALRALSYFYLVRVWGGVPLVTQPVNDASDINGLKLPRSNSDDIYAQISDDLNQSRNYLSALTSYSDPKQTRATITRGAVDAIMTDYYMWRNKPDSALIASARVTSNTQYSLAALYDPNIDYNTLAQTEIDKTDYCKMFSDGFSKESIFEVAYSYDENALSGLLSLFGGGTGVAYFYADASLVTSFRTGDLRELADFKNENQIFKNFPKSTFDKTTSNDKNIILYRLADILLLRAEALSQTGQRSAAWTIIKQIRERAFGPASSTNTYNNSVTGATGTTEQAKFLALSPEDAEDYILDERKKELCFEGKRWFDLVRTGRAIKVMQPINGLSNPDNILWPISLDVIRQNPNIEQNNFYK